MRYLFYVAVLLILGNFSAHAQDTLVFSDSIAQVQNTNQHASQRLDFEEPEFTGDFSPMLSFFALLGFVFVLLFVGAGIVLTAFALMVLGLLVGAGIISISIVVGLNKKSFSKGFKLFLVSTSTVVGTIIGLIVFWLLNLITHWWTLKTALLSGFISGIMAGFIFGLLAFYVIRKLTTHLIKRGRF